MKIALVARPAHSLPAQSGWAPGIVIADEAAALVAAGHDVRVYGASGSQVAGEFVDLGFPPLREAETGEISPAQAGIRTNFDINLFITKVAKHLRANPVDIIHLQDYRDYPIFEAAGIGIPVVCSIQGDYLYNFQNRIAPSTEVLKNYNLISLTDPGKLPKNLVPPIAVVPNSVDPEKFPLIAKPKPRLVFVGRFTKGKGIQHLSKIAERVNLPIDIYGGGSGDAFEAIQTHMIESHSKLHFKGRLSHEDIARVYDAVALIFPLTEPEGFPLTVLEAGASGTPTVAFDVGNMDQIVSDGQNGRVVKAGDLDAFAGAVNQIGLLNRPAVRRYTVERYGPERLAEDLTKVFNQVIRSFKG